ncbi:MAG: hypothetical protein IID40_10145, partial [Planctomycetes bacterium]|nr:hypothetical protein [Planctomycetota bacterium]
MIAAGGFWTWGARAAQLPDEPESGSAPPYTASVHDLSVDAQQIRIPLNHSVLIETSKPSERVQAI